MKQYWKIVRTEFVTIFKDSGLILILFGAMFIYGTLYPFIYGPEVARNVPVAVVDMDHTVKSRDLVRKLNATPDVNVKYMPNSLEEGRKLFMDREIFGILLIPTDYEKDIQGGVQTHVSLYADGGYFLLYSNFLGALSGVVQNVGSDVKVKNLMMSGMTQEQAELVSQPIAYKIENLFNPYNGYATALVPSVFLLIAQQLLLIGIGMAGGTWYEKRIWKLFRNYSATRLTFAKAMGYLLLYIPLMTYFFFCQYKIFRYPMHGSAVDLISVLLPYILACIFMGLTIGALCRRRETSLMLLVCTSIFFLMLSGISWPKEGMPGWMHAMGQLIPSSSGIEALVRIRTMGGTLDDVGQQMITLWMLVGIYGLTAVLATKIRILDINEIDRKTLRKRGQLRRNSVIDPSETETTTEPDHDHVRPTDYSE